MEYEFLACDLNRMGCMRDLAERLVVVDMGTDDVFNITIELVTGSWSTAVVHIHYANALTGPWVDFTNNLRFTSADRTTGLAAHVGRYVRCEVTTTPGAECRVDVRVHTRRSAIGQEVLV
jgi:hypothetical protein